MPGNRCLIKVLKEIESQQLFLPFVGTAGGGSSTGTKILVTSPHELETRPQKVPRP